MRLLQFPKFMASSGNAMTIAWQRCLKGGAKRHKLNAELSVWVQPSSRRRAMTWAWISAAPSKIDRMRASHNTRLTGYSSAKPLPPWIWSALSAAACVLLARGEISELAGKQDLGRHHHQLVRHARKAHDRLAELDALGAVAQPEVERGLGHADGPSRGLNARRLEGLHQLLEALALDLPKQIGSRNGEAVEGDVELLHAAIAE